MSKRMMFFPPKRRGPRVSTLFAGLALVSMTGASFAAGIHVGATYAVPGETPRVIVFASAFDPAE